MRGRRRGHHLGPFRSQVLRASCADMLRLYPQVSVNQLARAFVLSSSTVQRFLKEQGLKGGGHPGRPTNRRPKVGDEGNRNVESE